MSDVTPERETFVDLVLTGRARRVDVEDHVDAWHDAPEGSPAAGLELHEYLGMSWDEYRLWSGGTGSAS
jgi:hypothetical protein